MVDDLASTVSEVNGKGVPHLIEIVEQGRLRQVLCVDPSGNDVGLFQPG